MNALFALKNKASAEPISFQQAVRVLEAVKKYADNMGFAVSIAVVDPGGEAIVEAQADIQTAGEQLEQVGEAIAKLAPAESEKLYALRVVIAHPPWGLWRIR